MIKKFTVFGERCSGTTLLEQSILENFHIQLTLEFGQKHFFGFYEFCNNQNENDTLFIGIIRHPINWIYSFYVEEVNNDLSNFLTDEVYSVDSDGQIIKADLNMLNEKKYRNIFELRKIKNDYLANVLPNKVKNYILIRYEDLRDNYTKIMAIIQKKFNLRQKQNTIISTNLTNYKKESVSFDQSIIQLISSRLNRQQELKIGFNLKNYDF